MSITITITLTANLFWKKQSCSLSTKHKFRKEAPTSCNSAGQNLMSKIQSFSYHIREVNTSKCLVLISTKFINHNVSKANDEIF